MGRPIAAGVPAQAGIKRRGTYDHRIGRPQGRHDANLHRRRRHDAGHGARCLRQPRHPSEDRREGRLRGRAGGFRQAPCDAREQAARRPSRKGGGRSRSRPKGVSLGKARRARRAQAGREDPGRTAFQGRSAGGRAGRHHRQGIRGGHQALPFRRPERIARQLDLAPGSRLDGSEPEPGARLSRQAHARASRQRAPHDLQPRDRAHRPRAPAAAREGIGSRLERPRRRGAARGEGAEGAGQGAGAQGRPQGRSQGGTEGGSQTRSGEARAQTTRPEDLIMELKMIGSSGAVQAKDEIFARDFNEALVHQLVVAYQANARIGSRAQKDRGAVNHSTKKPWRQKGTGRARAGMTSSPLWRGGGKIFPNSPDENFTHKVNRKMYRAGIASILSQLAREDRIRVVDQFKVDAPKTKLLAQKVKAMGLQGVLVITDALDDNLKLSSRNLANVEVMDVRQANPVSLVHYPHVVLTKAAVDRLEEMLK